MSGVTDGHRAPFEMVQPDASEQIAREIRMYIDREGPRPGDRIGTENELAREPTRKTRDQFI